MWFLLIVLLGAIAALAFKWELAHAVGPRRRRSADEGGDALVAYGDAGSGDAGGGDAGCGDGGGGGDGGGDCG